jgi:molybdopterin biosynthesis enzyme MoaB
MYVYSPENPATLQIILLTQFFSRATQEAEDAEANILQQKLFSSHCNSVNFSLQEQKKQQMQKQTFSCNNSSSHSA